MPSLIPLLTAIGIGSSVGTSISGAAIGSKSKTVTTTPTLSPELQGAEGTDLAMLQRILSSPSAGLEPIQSAGSDSINRAYSKLPNTATNMLAARGFGQSGKVGDAVYDTEGARLGAQSDLYGQIAQLASGRQMNAAQIIQAMIAAGRGQSTTYPSNAGSAGLTTLGGNLGSLASLLTLQRMINGGGSAGSGSVPNVATGSGTANANTPVSIGDVLGSGAVGSPDPTGEGWA